MTVYAPNFYLSSIKFLATPMAEVLNFVERPIII